MSLKKLLPLINHQLIRSLGRDRLDYFCSNTFNLLTRQLNPFLWTFALKAVVLQRRVENNDVVSFELLPNQYWQQPQAGQFVEVMASIKGQNLERAYSISAVGSESFWITVKRHKQGEVSNALHDHLHIGDTLHLRGPFGTFTYQGQKALLFVFAGSGITPCFAIIQALLALPEAQRPDIQIYGQFSHPEDTIFGEVLTQWRAQSLQIKKFKVDLAYSQNPEEGSCLPLKANMLLDLCPDLQERHVYLCGPEGFKTLVLDDLASLELPMEHLHIEHFSLQTINAPDTSDRSCDGLSEIYFSAYNYRLQMQPEDRQKSILTLGLEHGLNLEKGCQKGYCGSCKLILHQGEVQGLTHGKAVYICQAYAKSKQVILGF